MIKFPVDDISFRNLKNVLSWGKTEFSIIKPHLKNFRVCLDIGAHIGLTTLRYAKYFEMVHSFEPLYWDCLTENTKDLSNVTIHKCAISNKSDIIQIYPNPKSSGRSIIPDKHNQQFIKAKYTGPNAPLRDVQLISIKCETIDQFEYNEVDLIKIDVEGHIIPVIEGMIDTLTRNSPIIQIEMSKMPEFKLAVNKVHNILLQLEYFKFSHYDEDWFYYKQKKDRK